MTPEENKERLYEHRKECLNYALNRNFEWAKRTNEIAIQVRKWAIGFYLIFFGFLVKDEDIYVKWFHFFIGISGIGFFMTLDLLQHYYSDVITKHLFSLNRKMTDLPMMNVDELEAISILPSESKISWGRWKKIKVILSMVLHETVLFFYGGLLLLTLGLLLALEYYP